MKMADSAQKVIETGKATEKVIEKTPIQDSEDSVKNGDSVKDSEAKVKNGTAVIKETDAETVNVENGNVKENGTKDVEVSGDACGIKRKSDVTVDTIDAVDKIEKKQKVDETVSDDATADVASNGDAEVKA